MPVAQVDGDAEMDAEGMPVYLNPRRGDQGNILDDGVLSASSPAYPSRPNGGLGPASASWPT